MLIWRLHTQLRDGAVRDVHGQNPVSRLDAAAGEGEGGDSEGTATAQPGELPEVAGHPHRVLGGRRSEAPLVCSDPPEAG